MLWTQKAGGAGADAAKGQLGPPGRGCLGVHLQRGQRPWAGSAIPQAMGSGGLALVCAAVFVLTSSELNCP